MKALWFGCCLLMLMASCENIKKRITPFEILTKQIDSLKQCSDTVALDTFWLVKEYIPVTADESFADFFYNFASDAQFQYSRVLFPIPFCQDKEVRQVSKKEWVYDPLFSQEPVYTVLFDSAEEMEMEKDTSIHRVQVDWIYLAENKIKRYYFERKQDYWFLKAVNMEEIMHETDGGEDFLSFYSRFATDSIFQHERLCNPLVFVTADPEDEFRILETTLDEGQWFAFRPPMMKDKLTNVRYGQTETFTSKTKVVEFKGFGNGFSNVMYFERRNGIWKLFKFEDLSD